MDSQFPADQEHPVLEGEIVGAKPQGSQVTLEGQEGDWYQVDLGDGQPAYMSAEYIEIEENEALTMEEYQALQAAEAQAAREAQQQEQAAAAAASVSGGELDLLAALIQCEAGGESHTGKVAVGAVVMNRVRSGQFPNSITEVVYQSGQFSRWPAARFLPCLRREPEVTATTRPGRPLPDPIRWEDASTLTADPDRESRSAISIFINDHREYLTRLPPHSRSGI